MGGVGEWGGWVGGWVGGRRERARRPQLLRALGGAAAVQAAASTHPHPSVDLPAPTEYDSELPWLQQVSQDDLVQLLRSEGRKQAAQRMLKQKVRG